MFANPTFTGEIGIGDVNVSETELGLLEGATSLGAGSLASLGITATAAEINILDDGLSASNIPSLAASKITSGTFADARIATAATWNAKQDALTIATGIVNASGTVKLDFNTLTDVGTATVIATDFIPVYDADASGTKYKRARADKFMGKITSVLWMM